MKRIKTNRSHGLIPDAQPAHFLLNKHTRIWERSGDGHGAEVSLSTVTRAVARPGRGFAAERDEAFMDLVWHPGEAQADFGEVDVLLRGVVRRMHHFVPGFPYSNVGLVQSMPGGNAECTCLALRNLFEWLGGVPERIVFDNAAGVGHKGYGEREPRPAAPVPRVPGALRVRLLVGQPVFRPREGRGGVQGRHGAAPARPSCPAGTPPDNQENKKNACNCLNPKKYMTKNETPT